MHRLETLFGVKKVDGDIGKKKNRASRKERTKAKKKEQDTKIDALRNLLIKGGMSEKDVDEHMMKVVAENVGEKDVVMTGHEKK